MMNLSDKIRHFFHLVSNVRPVIWIGVYLVLIPFFAFIYWLMPDSQFRMPDDAIPNFGSWMYYSIVTISTLGFGDYTPGHFLAQFVTAIEVISGLSVFGFFLNSVGSMKSEIDVGSEIERQRMLSKARETDKLVRNIPRILYKMNQFLAFCYAVTTPENKRGNDNISYDPNFKFSDMRDMFKKSGLPMDHKGVMAVDGLLACASRTSLFLDRLEDKVNLSLWPELMQCCFSFVANTQLFFVEDDFSSQLITRTVNGKHIDIKDELKLLSDEIAQCDKVPVPGDDAMGSVAELYRYIKENTEIALRIETICTEIDNSEKNAMTVK